jgi:hypothetical protein
MTGFRLSRWFMLILYGVFAPSLSLSMFKANRPSEGWGSAQPSGPRGAISREILSKWQSDGPKHTHIYI